MAAEMPGEPRTLRLQHGNRIEALCVLGGHIRADVFGAAPAGAGVAFGVKHTEGVSVDVLLRGRAEPEAASGAGARWPLDEGTALRFSMSRASSEVNDNKVTVSFYAEGGKPINQAGVFLTGVDPFFGQRYTRVLGGRKLFHTVPYPGGAAQLDFFVEGLRFPDETFSGLVSIHVSLLEPLAEVGNSRELPGTGQMGGRTREIWDGERSHEPIPNVTPGEELGGNGAGTSQISAWLPQGIPRSPIFTDTVVFRAAPWILTPNTLAPVNLFVCSMKDNYLFTKEIQSLVAKAGCKLKVCFGYTNRGDRWMQDEIELGYTHAPHKSFPVVLDSPRERGMEKLPVKELLGPDFGYVLREPLFEAVASLDSFGNVEVSPPVCVAGKEYPLGRILVGSSFPA
ncbi:hypothetical protein DUI87_00075 [Hirundo rustica rustica]|uniref:Uncharacterized protein n=1 Tax=Hirundo rustica rustica TaxID=333673 RepID=A0A3M0LBY5_HIRRU|nr:hypothetical protein DUI87_00075 [Hirundo rustica rustica]